MIIYIGDNEYDVEVVDTPEAIQQGLKGVADLPKDKGMLFKFDKPGNYPFYMKDTIIPLDLIFINEDNEVIFIYEAKPNDEKLVGVDNTKYVLEVNPNSGIKVGDELTIDDGKEYVMKVLAPDGSAQMELRGGERIISRKETKTIISKVKRADLSKADKDYKALGRYIFKVFNKLDNRKPEYVQKPNE